MGMRSKSWWRELLLALFALQSPRKTDDASDQAVIIRVCAVAEALIKALVKAVLVRARKGMVRNMDSQAFQPWSSDEQQQREIGDLLLRKIGQSLFNHFLAGQ